MFWKVILAIWSPGTSHWPHHPPHKRSWPIVSNLASSCYSLPIPPSHLSSLTDPRKPDSFLLCWVVKSSQCSFPKFCSSSPPFCIQKPTRSLIGPALSRKNLWFEATFSPLAYVQDWEECEILASGALEVLVREARVSTAQPYEAAYLQQPVEAPGRMRFHRSWSWTDRSLSSAHSIMHLDFPQRYSCSRRDRVWEPECHLSLHLPAGARGHLCPPRTIWVHGLK